MAEGAQRHEFAGEMPPEKKPQPKNAEKADFLDDLAQTMVLRPKKTIGLWRQDYYAPAEPT